ncbi:hypothetical protein LWI28_008658 [Acer negundo]|uniref:Uncharacterized protein n=1 Tax=Acer negundo TaxID=4023 RepID=A0AAD5P426_ACENE|nr:hypothetical protein LWI28_008658 [Acer negundo]
MYFCSTKPNPAKRFKAKVKLPWNGEYKLVGDDKELQQVFKMFTEKSIHSIRFDFELLPCAAFTPEKIIRSHSTSLSSDEDEDYIPHFNSRGSTSGSQDDNSGYSVNDIEPAINEEASDDDFNDQQLPNAASFNLDNGFARGEVLPLGKQRLPGRPKKNRKRGHGEPLKHKRSASGKCRGYSEYGYNIRTCSQKAAGNWEIRVSSSSGTCTSRRVQVEETIAVTLTRIQNASHPTQSNANLGTVAGLDIDWSALF